MTIPWQKARAYVAISPSCRIISDSIFSYKVEKSIKPRQMISDMTIMTQYGFGSLRWLDLRKLRVEIVDIAKTNRKPPLLQRQTINILSRF